MESDMARRDKTDAWDERREQPQGEANASNSLAKYARCDVVKRKGAQTEGGEKPPRLISCDSHGNMHWERTPLQPTFDGTTCSNCNGTGRDPSVPPPSFLLCPYCNGHSEPSSPPATAGTAREFYKLKYGYEPQRHETFSIEAALKFADEHADQRVRPLQANLAKLYAAIGPMDELDTVDDAVARVEKLRQERDALKAKVEALNG